MIPALAPVAGGTWPGGPGRVLRGPRAAADGEDDGAAGAGGGADRVGPVRRSAVLLRGRRSLTATTSARRSGRSWARFAARPGFRSRRSSARRRGRRCPTGPCSRKALAAWARVCPRPLVLFFDEIDALRGQSLISVLRQLRAGFTGGRRSFPASVVLCGLRDVRDYKAAVAGGDPEAGFGVPSREPVQHQVGVAAAGGLHPGRGAPALRPAHRRDRAGVHPGGGGAGDRADRRPAVAGQRAGPRDRRKRSASRSPSRSRSTTWNRPRNGLSWPAPPTSTRWRRNSPTPASAASSNPSWPAPWSISTPTTTTCRYVRDLGLISPRNPVRVANPIYREVIARVLTDGVEAVVFADPRSFVLPDGRLDFAKLLDEFADFWMENGEILAAGRRYHEAAPHLVLMGFLQRVVNGGGYVDREYGIGRGRIDLLDPLALDRPGRQTPVAARSPRTQSPPRGRRGPDPARPGPTRRLPRPPRPRPRRPRRLRPPPRRPDDHRTHRLRHVTSPAGRTITLLRA